MGTARGKGANDKPILGGPLPKIEPLLGSLQPEWKRCGKQGCRCGSGELHGPYWYRRWREGGRQRKAYVPRNRIMAVQRAISLGREVRAPLWAMRQMLAELRRLEEEVPGWATK